MIDFVCLIDCRDINIDLKIGDLKEMERLSFDHMKLTAVPKEIGNLERLQYLHLNDNQLTSVPTEIGNLEHLREL